MAEKQITAEEFDRRFDAGEDIADYIDWTKAKRPGHEELAKLVQQLQETKRRLLEEAGRIDDVLKAFQHT